MVEHERSSAVIRRAKPYDLAPLAKLLRQLHEHHVRLVPESHRMPFDGYFEMQMRSFFEDEKMHIFVEELGGAITAYAVVNIFERDRAERIPARILYIEHFAVDENSRRQGSGTRLFEHLKGFAKENGCSLIQLGAAAKNADALSFYESMGMEPMMIRLELKL